MSQSRMHSAVPKNNEQGASNKLTKNRNLSKKTLRSNELIKYNEF